MASDFDDAIRYLMGSFGRRNASVEEIRDRQVLEERLEEHQRNLRGTIQRDMAVRMAAQMDSQVAAAIQTGAAQAQYRPYRPEELNRSSYYSWQTGPEALANDDRRLALMEMQIKRLRLVAKELLKLCAEPNMDTKSVVIDHVQQILEQEGMEWKDR